MFKATKKILNEINLKIDETFKDINNNFSDIVAEKEKQLGKYEEQIKSMNAKLLEFEHKYKILSAKTGGLTRGNNKLKNDKVNLVKDIKNKNQTIKNQLQKIDDLLIKSAEVEALKAIIVQQEKIISKKLSGVPSKEKIINYDKKAPIMK